jgi:hypothetical protein
MDARRNLDLARELIAGAKTAAPLTGGGGEPAFRFAIGRCYYAGFLTARQFLRDIGIAVPHGGAAHAAVQFALNNSGVDLLARVASQLRDLYESRTAADYELSDPEPERVAVAEVALGRAEFIFTAFDLIRVGRVSPPLSLAAVANAILAWAKANGQDSRIRRL